MTQSGSSNNDPKKSWLLTEFGLLNNAKHTTKKKLKAKSITFAKTAQMQLEADYNNGFKKGYDAGLAQGANEVNKKLTQLSALICELTAYKNTLDDQFKNNIHQFSLMICEKIIMEKINLSENVILNILNRALDVIEGQSSPLKVYCNQNLLQQLPNQTNSKRIIFDKDDSLKDYSFRIESDRQFLEFNLHEALKELIHNSKEALIGNLSQS